MLRLAKSRRLNLLLALLFALSIVASACGASNGGAPQAPGQYSVQKDSVRFDGDRYQLYWADTNGSLHQLDTRKLRLVRDPDKTFLEVPQGGGDPILHLREDEPISVQGQDHQGAFSSPWFPFLVGAAVGNAFGGGFGGFGGRGGGQTIIINNPAPGERSYDPSAATYRYPPTGTFGRDDSLHGSLDTSKPQVPDYSKVQPSAYATAGQSSGTGGGVAASNKSPSGQSSGASNATAGQSGGTGSGVAASSKGGFASGTQSFSNQGGSSGSVGAGSRGTIGNGSSANSGAPSGSVSKPSSGGSSSSGSKGLGGARAPSVGRR
ncbi:MAG TPA: hypothetical protein VGQ62_22165 [Chloroflexota bacterium]|nr:hypothetical protein [Chloroflexota bacterium]